MLVLPLTAMASALEPVLRSIFKALSHLVLDRRIGQTAALQACKFIEENLSMRVETLGKETLINCAKTAMSSKIVGSESDFFSQLVVDAVTAVKTEPKGETSNILVFVSRLVCSEQIYYFPSCRIGAMQSSQSVSA